MPRALVSVRDVRLSAAGDRPQQLRWGPLGKGQGEGPSRFPCFPVVSVSLVGHRCDIQPSDEQQRHVGG